MVGFVHGRVRIQAGIGHDTVDKVIDHHSDGVNSAEALLEAALRLLLV